MTSSRWCQLKEYAENVIALPFKDRKSAEKVASKWSLWEALWKVKTRLLSMRLKISLLIWLASYRIQINPEEGEFVLITPQVEGKAECLYRMMKRSAGVPSYAMMFEIPKESLLLYLSLFKNLFEEKKLLRKIGILNLKRF